MFDGGLARWDSSAIRAVTLACLFATAHTKPDHRGGQEWSRRGRDFIMFWITRATSSTAGSSSTPALLGTRRPTFTALHRRLFAGAYLPPAALLFGDGQYSYVLTVLHNQTVIMISAALLGLLAFRLAFVPEQNFPCGCLGLSCMSYYQSFEELMHYWLFSPHAMFVLFLMLFLLNEEIRLRAGNAFTPRPSRPCGRVFGRSIQSTPPPCAVSSSISSA